jgi:hypothetical protein
VTWPLPVIFTQTLWPRLVAKVNKRPALSQRKPAAGREFTGSESARVWRQGPGWQRIFLGRFLRHGAGREALALVLLDDPFARTTPPP